MRTQRNRGLIGLQFRYEMMHFATQFLFDLTDPSGEGQQFLQSSRQWTLSFEVGVYF